MFIILGKPILFYQFDLDKYNETNGSYIDMEKDLFGERCLTREELLPKIHEYYENGFKENELHTQKCERNISLITTTTIADELMNL